MKKEIRKILAILLCLISSSVFSQEGKFTRVTDDTRDFRNNLWYYGANSFGELDTFLYTFGYRHIERTIAEDNFAGLREPYYTICANLLNRGRNIAIPDRTFSIMIICDDKYGVMLFWWNDTSPAVIMGVGPGQKLMFRHFFELKI